MPRKTDETTEQETTGARTSEAITETGPPAGENRFADKQASLTAAREAEEERVQETIQAVRSGEIVAETSNQRAPTAEEQARIDKGQAIADTGVGFHAGLVRRGDIDASGQFAVGVTGDIGQAAAKEYQVTKEVLDSPTFQALDPDSQRHIDSLLLRHPAIVRNGVMAVPLEDPSVGSDVFLSEGSQVPEGLGFVPANYVDRKRRIALS